MTGPTYRYILTRAVTPLTGSGTCLFVMLNPSTADDHQDDPTIRRCVGFTRSWGYAELRVVNLFAARATDPKELASMFDPVGSGNDQVLADELSRADLVVAAWGAHPMARRRAPVVLGLVPGVAWNCLGHTKRRAPEHPLYVHATRNLRPFEPPREGAEW